MGFSMRKRIAVFVALVCAICLVGAAKPPERTPAPDTGTPGTPRIVGVTLNSDGDFFVTWRAAEGDVTSYVLEAGPSRFAREDLWQTALVVKGANTCSATVPAADGYDPEDPYACYFRVRARKGKGKKAVKGDPSEARGIEMTLFGDHTYVFAETDDAAAIDRTIEELFVRQNDRQSEAEFKADHYQVYFKPGDYTQCACMNVGFYTAFGGLGKVPTDTKLNNIAVPPYLSDNNATCDFWRSVENVAVCDTGNEQGLAGYGSTRPEQFNWAVAQAAPLRRIYSERPLAYDWNYGWASGGLLADSRVVGYFTEGESKRSAGTTTGQQFYTRNSELIGNVYGITLNAVYQGVIAPNLPNEDTGTELYDGRGYSDWAISGTIGGNNWDYWQQCITNVTKTNVIREKPFLYVEDGEYWVFVPALRTDAVGPSWEEDDMGPGTSLSLADDFYVASPSDSAAFINKRIAAGKSIYFTPGVYHVDEPIIVDRPDTVLLGSGLASIVPDKGGSAMRIGDVEGVTVAGLMFDAGPKHSENLLQVGTEQADDDGASAADDAQDGDDARNPTLLTDLFFRIGGVLDEDTSVHTALQINSDHVIGDHFWLWRADHGSGVGWHNNVAQQGLEVNGDDVTVYGLFSEHFEGYAVLWNGEDGSTYFYQNETPYDPITQDASSDDAWLSHNGSVYGYASYKVANSVHTHYAVGLGMYNVFVHTGGGSADTTEYDGGAQIKLRNAMEVPNREGVVIENACLQTFAATGENGGLYQETQHIINDVGYGVSQGYLRTEARDAEGALVGNLLDRNGEELQTRIVCTPYESNGRRQFWYKVYEIDWTGAPIIYDGVEELNLDTLPDDVSWDINTGGFVLIAPWGEVDPSDYRQICGTRPVSESRSRAVRGRGWARTFVTRYCNGAATFSMAQHAPALWNRFVGLETYEGARQLGDDVDYSELETQYKRAKEAVESHEPKGKRMAAALRGVTDSLEQADLYMDENNESYLPTRRYAMQDDVDALATELGEAVDALEAEDEAKSSSDAKSSERKSLAKAHVSGIPVQPWTGEAITPEPAVRLGGRALVLGTDYTLSYKKNVNAGTAAVIIKGKGDYKGKKKVRFSIVKPSVCYMTHVQDYGQMEWVADGDTSGAAAELRRLEAIKVRLANQPVAGSIRYRSHVENFGWEANWSEDGEMSGTSGKSKRLEAVQIELTGEMAKCYDVCYCVCEEGLGWMDWVRNGETAGTEGMGRLLEAIRIAIVPKGGSVDLG